MAMKEFTPGEKIRAADFNDNFDETQKAENITSGTLDVARVPDLDASKITTGVIGENRLPPSFPTYVGSRYFTSSGTFDRLDAFGDGSNIEAKAVKVRLVGGGGGACGITANQSGRGGGGGGYAERFISPFSENSTAVTVGARGNGGANTPVNGDAGGTSSFGSFASATGGAGGRTNRETLGAAGGSGTAPGGIVFDGNPGMGDGASSTGGAGGSSHLGGGGRAWNSRDRCQNRQGADASGFGGGGGGGIRVCSGNGTRGGHGRAGLVIVDVYA